MAASASHAVPLTIDQVVYFFDILFFIELHLLCSSVVSFFQFYSFTLDLIFC